MTERTLIRPAAGDEGSSARLHTLDGSVYALRRWRRTPTSFEGEGERFDLDRRRLETGTFHLDVREVAEIETSRPRAGTLTWAVAALVGLTATSATFAVLCVVVPSLRCVGSSP